jgi:hypothetical protein
MLVIAAPQHSHAMWLFKYGWANAFNRTAIVQNETIKWYLGGFWDTIDQRCQAITLEGMRTNLPVRYR